MIDIVSKTRKLLSALQSSQSELGRNIHSTRNALDAKRAEREEILRSPLPRDESLARIDGAVNAAEGLSGVEDFVHKITTGAPIDFLGGHNNQQWMTYMLAHVARPVLVAALDRFYENHDGLTSAQREERLAKLEGDIYDLGRQEELALRASEEVGARPSRRVDADPAILLLSNEELGLS
jgi:hypothetical protein